MAVKSPFTNFQLAYMVIAQFLLTQEYTHSYCVWKNISVKKRTWVHFKTYFQESYLYREELEQTAGAAGYGSANNVKHV